MAERKRGVAAWVCAIHQDTSNTKGGGSTWTRPPINTLILYLSLPYKLIYLYSILWAIITEKSRLVILFGSWAASFCSESWSFARPPICLRTQWWWNKVKKGWGVAMWRSQTIRFFIMSDRTQVSVSESHFLLTMLSAHNAVALITLLNYKMHWFNRQIKETEERAHCLFLSWRQSAWPGCYTDVGTSFRLHLGQRGWGRSWWLPSSWFLLACCSLVNLH